VTGPTAATAADPILDVEGVTIRFGGLTAVSEVDLRVPSGSIFAVIGPNGAGKTTLFNAITGIERPAAGKLRFEGRDLREPLTPGRILRWALAGLSMGIFLLVFASSPDALWAATIKQNYQGPGTSFEVGRAFRDLAAAIRAEPRVEQRAGRFVVVGFDGERLPYPPVVTLVEARTRAREAVDDRPGVGRARRTRLAVFVLGTVLGFAGGAAVFHRSRFTPGCVSRRGIARTFQNIRLFGDMSVLENVLVGADRHVARDVPRWPPGGREARARAEAASLLAFVGLDGMAERRASTLAYGDQRRLEIARALATRPRLLLLDEPAAGLNPSEAVALGGLIRKIRDLGTTVLLIEHRMRMVMGTCERIAVLEHGKKICEGTPDEVKCDARVIEAYLGREEHH